MILPISWVVMRRVKLDDACRNTQPYFNIEEVYFPFSFAYCKQSEAAVLCYHSLFPNAPAALNLLRSLGPTWAVACSQCFHCRATFVCLPGGMCFVFKGSRPRNANVFSDAYILKEFFLNSQPCKFQTNLNCQVPSQCPWFI